MPFKARPMANMVTIENMSRPPRAHLRSIRWPAPGTSQPAIRTIVGNEEDCAVRVCAETSVAIAGLMITGWMPGRTPMLVDKVDRIRHLSAP